METSLKQCLGHELQSSEPEDSGEDPGQPSGHAPLKASAINGGMEPKAPLTNPLAFHITDWAPGPMGKPRALVPIHHHRLSCY